MLIRRNLHLCNDNINKYDYIMPASSLNTALEQSWQNGSPSGLGHDVTKPIGWIYATSLLFTNWETLLLGCQTVPCSDEEQAKLIINAKSFWTKHHYDLCKEYEDDLKKEFECNLEECIYTCCPCFKQNDKSVIGNLFYAFIYDVFIFLIFFEDVICDCKFY